MNVAEIVFLVIALIVVLMFMWALRVGFKAQNPKHSSFDDFLLFSGCPVVFAYIILILFSPKLVRWTLVAVGWLVINSTIFMVRYYRNRKKVEKK
jgi:hypothetical protein